MRAAIVMVLFFSTAIVAAQNISQSQQGALNSCVEYANQSAQEYISVFTRIVSYYPDIARAQKGKGFVRPFTCGDALDDYFYKQAIAKVATLSMASQLTPKLNDLRHAAEAIDGKCKALDTYYKLKDYQKDQYKNAYGLISEMQPLMADYRRKQVALAEALDKAYRTYQTTVSANSYNTANQMMRKELARERAFLDSWTFNLNDEVHTGWPIDKLEASIPETEQAARQFSQNKFTIKYPAVSMIGSFGESLLSILETKRSSLDGYNYEARKSDKHSNQTYLDLINYFNGTLVSDQNMFVQYSSADGFYGLKSIQFAPLFDIRTVAVESKNPITPFEDTPHISVNPSVQTAPIGKTTFAALSAYIEFMNESVRQMNYLHNVLRNFNSSARYYKDLTSYSGKGGLQYEHEGFQLPLSLYQSLVTQSIAIPATSRNSLLEQAAVLLAILKEMDQLSIALTQDAAERRYEKDNLTRAFEILNRNALLFDIADSKKEQLYADVRTVYESYPIANAQGSWAISYKSLLKLLDEDKNQFNVAKTFFHGNPSSIPTTDAIDRYLREVIANEYSNMKGIERYGRSNGLCPYTPYEDMPEHSRTFSEKLAGIRTAKSSSSDGPFYDYVYLFNIIADDYDKFCELAKIDLLKTVHQPVLYVVQAPASPDAREENPTGRVRRDTDGAKNGAVIGAPAAIATGATRVRDTIYIEKHDTVYMGAPGEDLMSMKGYATNNLVFLLDVSGSMSSGQKLPLLKKSMSTLLTMLRPEDQVSIVVYSGKARVALPPTSAAEKSKISKAIDNLKSDGETDGNAGIRLAYKVADGNYIRAGNNRIVLATDGEFPISSDTHELVVRFSANDIFLTVFNYGKNPVENLARLAAEGKGNFEFITHENSDFKLIREAKGKRN